VSYYQQTIDWPAVRAGGKRFAFIRVSDGQDFQDPKWTQNWQGAEAAGIYRGAYQFFRAGDDAVAQADLLLDAIGSIGPTDLPPVLDLEVSDGQRAATVTRKALIWLERVEAALGRKPIIYTGVGYTSAIGNPAALGEYPLWVANWTTRCPSMPPMWSEWKFWQNGIGRARSVAGIRTGIDLDYFNGSLAELAAYAGPHGN
jgi:lysozyme